MKYKSLIITVLIALIPLLSNAQHTAHHHKSRQHKTEKKQLPDWATAHNYDAKTNAYFPDYYTFYDAKRGGYVFWKNGQWSFTPTMPPYMSNKDLSKARVKILKGLSLDLHPETDYPKYMKMYPPVRGADGNDVPVPTPLPYRGNQ